MTFTINADELRPSTIVDLIEVLSEENPNDERLTDLRKLLCALVGYDEATRLLTL